MSDASDRTIPATPRRRKEAEDAGMTPTASLLGWCVSLAAVFACLPAWCRGTGMSAVAWFRDAFVAAERGSETGAMPIPSGIIAATVGLVVVAVAASLGVRVLFDRLRFQPSRCLPDPRRIGLLRGAARLFSASTVWRTIQSAVAVGVLVVAAGFSLGRFMAGLGDMMVGEPTASLMLAWQSLWPVIAAALGIVFAQWVLARLAFERSIRMTPQEYQDELRSLEADPKVMLQRHRMQKAKAR